MTQLTFSEGFSPTPPPPAPEEDVVELSFLFPGAQLEELERVAHRQGLSAGQLIRVLLADYLKRNRGQTTACRERG